MGIKGCSSDPQAMFSTAGSVKAISVAAQLQPNEEDSRD